jgi:putative molybdopterin biosynthesis protein
MDGIAVRAASTSGAGENRPLTLVRGRDFTIVNTGDPVQPPYDAVIMAEDAAGIDGDTAQIREAAAPWQHIRPIGEDIVTGEMLLPGRHRIRPIDIGVLLSGGISRIWVFQQPRAAIFPTGSEIVEPDQFPGDQVPGEGAIIESNSRMLEAMVIQGGGLPSRFPPVPDNYEMLRDAIKKAAASFDLVLVNAGSSAGTGDFTVHVLREIGQVIVHGVAMKPGKPVILAIVEGRPVIGIPGYPVSAYLAYENFAAPVLGILSGRASPPHSGGTGIAQAVIAKRLVSSLKHREYVRVKVGRVDGRLVASPLARGAGAAMSLVRADGFCVIEQNSEGIEAGETAPVKLYRSLEEIDRTLVAIGSHDLILDVIADLMAVESGGSAFLASSHTGSLAGLMALKRGECHIAPTHLLDEESGEYNIAYIKQIFSGSPMALVKGVGRIQGLMVQKGNPLGIQSVDGLVGGCRYINRQRGAGTRLFLDFKLKQAGIAPDAIAGYDREAATHMAVAAAVANNNADAGMGISSAAAALGLDFIPLGEEEYDFALRPCSLELPMVKIFLEVLKSAAFQARLEELGAYAKDHLGEIVNVEEGL